jgi:hypothetical protein
VTRRAVSTLSAKIDRGQLCGISTEVLSDLDLPTEIEIADHHVIAIDSCSACTSERCSSWLVLQFRLVLANDHSVVWINVGRQDCVFGSF